MLPYCWNDQTPLCNHELRMDDDVYKNRQDPAVTRRLPPRDRRAGPGLDHDPVDPADQPRDGGRPRHRLRRRRVGLHRADRALPPRRGPPRRAHAASWARTLPSAWSSGSRAATSSGARYTPPFSYYLGHDEVARRPRRRLRHHRRRHRHRAHRRRPSVRRTSSSPTSTASRRSCPSARTAGSPSRSPTTRACTSSTPTPSIIEHLKAATARAGRPRRGHRGHRAAAPRDLRPLATRTAGAAASP